jgi:hypothetical protein
MALPTEPPIDEIKRLQRCINDFVSILIFLRRGRAATCHTSASVVDCSQAC